MINSDVEDFSNIKKEELIEIADYDPIKNILLVIGPMEPKIETPIHWMIHHAREEINSIVQINSSILAENLVNKLPIVDDKYPIGTIENIKEILKSLRDNNKIIIGSNSILFVGNRLRDVEDIIFITFIKVYIINRIHDNDRVFTENFNLYNFISNLIQFNQKLRNTLFGIVCKYH